MTAKDQLPKIIIIMMMMMMMMMMMIIVKFFLSFNWDTNTKINTTVQLLIIL